MKLTLVASTLAFATTTFAAGPVGYGQQSGHQPASPAPNGYGSAPPGAPSQGHGQNIGTPPGKGGNGGSTPPKPGQNGGMTPPGSSSPPGGNFSPESQCCISKPQGPQPPASGYSSSNQPFQCITPEEGQQWLQQFISVLGHTAPNLEQTANEIIADQYTEISNSILSLQGKPLSAESVSAPSKQAWIQGITHAPPPQGIQTKEVVYGCDKLAWYWTFAKVGAGQYPQNGFNLFHFTRAGGKLQAKRLDLEFDSIAWGLNTGELESVTYADGRVQVAAMKFQGGPPSGGASGRGQQK